jgi:hypothetical protein
VVLFAPEDSIRSYRNATIRYWVKKPAASATLEIVDPKGTVVRTFNGGGASTPAVTAGADTGRGVVAARAAVRRVQARPLPEQAVRGRAVAKAAAAVVDVAAVAAAPRDCR